MESEEMEQTIQELKQRVRMLEDLEEIKELHRNYINWVNNLQFEEVINCFIENAVADLHGHHEGKKQIENLFKNVIAENLKNWDVGHFVTTPIISINGDRAKGSWLFYGLFANKPPTGQPRKWVQARHDAEYVKLDGKWKFSYLKFTSPWPERFKI
jgi:hypothetical protein